MIYFFFYMLLKPTSGTSFYYHIKQPFFTSFSFVFLLLRTLFLKLKHCFCPVLLFFTKKQPFHFDPAFFLLDDIPISLYYYSYIFLNTQSSEDFTNNIIISVFLNHATSASSAIVNIRWIFLPKKSDKLFYNSIRRI